jgi:hypothetical protein
MRGRTRQSRLTRMWRKDRVLAPGPSPNDGYQTVGWYDDKDPENPLNWSTGKKTFTYFQICLLTFSGMFSG